MEAPRATTAPGWAKWTSEIVTGAVPKAFDRWMRALAPPIVVCTIWRSVCWANVGPGDCIAVPREAVKAVPAGALAAAGTACGAAAGAAATEAAAGTAAVSGAASPNGRSSGAAACPEPCAWGVTFPRTVPI
ncbi:hypothetical protein [Streptomyces tremellae]|uniref:Uncharacterized protein n=1 Tax=Streptomyces tremellae TaxID=1124239 RepID=A0ABP7G5K4_9ACTN